MTQPQSNPAEPTPVDDVRCVRERLDREAQGNLHVLAEQSQAAVERYRGPLKLKVVPVPVHDVPRAEKST